MSDPPTLFDGLTVGDVLDQAKRMARRTDPVTSHLAAAGNLLSGANASQRAACLAAMEDGVGMTSDEIAAAAGVTPHVSGRRLPELERAGLVVRGPARVSKVGGRLGTTWVKVGQ